MTTMFTHQTLGTKKQFYHSNGTGRDQYINYFSGGQILDKEVYVEGVYEKGTMRQKISKAPSLPRIEAKYAHYFSDGTGRDNYIVCNEGGMNNSPNLLVAKNPNYLQSLRHYQPVQLAPRENDFLRRTLAIKPLKWYAQQQKEFDSQQQLASKLSVPKLKRQKIVKSHSSLGLGGETK